MFVVMRTPRTLTPPPVQTFNAAPPPEQTRRCLSHASPDQGPPLWPTSSQKQEDPPPPPWEPASPSATSQPILCLSPQIPRAPQSLSKTPSGKPHPCFLFPSHGQSQAVPETIPRVTHLSNQASRQASPCPLPCSLPALAETQGLGLNPLTQKPTLPDGWRPWAQASPLSEPVSPRMLGPELRHRGIRLQVGGQMSGVCPAAGGSQHPSQGAVSPSLPACTQASHCPLPSTPIKGPQR